jgi:hypothetical protein
MNRRNFFQAAAGAAAVAAVPILHARPLHQRIRCRKCSSLLFTYNGDIRKGTMRAGLAYFPDGTQPKHGSVFKIDCPECGSLSRPKQMLVED